MLSKERRLRKVEELAGIAEIQVSLAADLTPIPTPSHLLGTPLSHCGTTGRAKRAESMETTLWFLVAVLSSPFLLPEKMSFQNRSQERSTIPELQRLLFCISMCFETKSLYSTDGALTLDLSVLDYKDMKDSSHSKSPLSLHEVWQSGMRLGPFKSQLGTPQTSSTVPGSVNPGSQCSSDLQAPVPEVPRPTRWLLPGAAGPRCRENEPHLPG